MKLGITLSLLSLLASTSWAHFTLDSPKTRGFDEDKESNNFCGGFPDVSLPRQPWFYRNGPISIDSHHPSATVNIYIAFDVPTSAQSFLTTANGTTIPPLRHDLAIKGTGEFCFHANAADLNVAGVKVESGTNATIMVEYINDVHGHLYQCSDVTFTDDAKVGANVSCSDSLTAASASASGSAGGSASGSGSASAATSSAPAANKANGAMAVGIPMLSLALLPALAAGALLLA
ncbi:uncharacterized protein UTRI_06131_B [Ustilago trichophora]|uniref:Copper acquisition factor BIM1-like domain-containing protein n=1 Tax=Ustilago trichophora TaxID=86804 RepID=A0A5C3EKV5_9BASI|nr:uncharacterized protein UTRI_06131_B [Ustilago trichophora]